ncbi:MAG: aminoglycoside phosphotransferase family protein [Myxococcales bacterium]|nr:aminoglycoside phosphotransferase family protein [Myxococcales bacterium]
MREQTPRTGPLEAVEAAWERSIPLPELTPSRLARWTAPFAGLGDRRWILLGGGLRSLNLRSGELVLRVAQGDRRALAKEGALLRRLEGIVRVPRVLDASDEALLLEYVPHGPLPPTERAGARAGAAAARIHALTFGNAGFLDASLTVTEPFDGALEGLRAWADGLLDAGAGARLGAARVAAIRRLWDDHHGELAAACARPVLVHSDFKPTNVRWLAEEDDVLVLDWEFAWSGPGLLDVGMMLRWRPPAAFVRGFAAGLRAGGQVLPARWARVAELLDLFNLVGLLERAQGRRLEDLLGRVDATLDDT